MRPFLLVDGWFKEDHEIPHNFHDSVVFARCPPKQAMNLLPIPFRPDRGARGFEGINPLQVPR